MQTSMQWESPMDQTEFNILIRDLTPTHILKSNSILTTHENVEVKKKKTKVELMKEKIAQENMHKQRERELSMIATNISEDGEASLDVQMCLLKSIRHSDVRRQALIKLVGVALRQKDWYSALSIYLVLHYEAPLTDIERKHENLKWAREIFRKKKMDPVEVQFTGQVDLAPMNKFLVGNIKFDPWQNKVNQMIDEGISPLVVAPTSCGKTQLSILQVEKHNKILIVEPTPALVFEVAAIVRSIIGDHICLISGSNMIKFSHKEPRVWIGTPLELEAFAVQNNLFKVVDYAIIDEIHCINDPKMGSAIERILYAIQCQFIALSATIDIESAKQVIEFWNRRLKYQKVALFVHTERYINLTKWVFQDKKLMKIHPLASIKLDDLIDEARFKLLDFALTPQDSWALYQSILELDTEVSIQTDHEKIYPETTLLHLDDTRRMEASLKEDLRNLAIHDPEAVEAVFDDFYLKPVQSSDFNITDLALELKNNQKTPAIIFVEDSASAIGLVKNLVDGLEKYQEQKYPNFHHDIEKRVQMYQRFQDALESIRKIKISRTSQFKSSQDVEDAIQRRTQEEQDAEKEGKGQSTPVDVWAPHPDVVMSPGGPIHDDFVKKARITLSQASGIRIGYENILIRALRLGIAVFTQDMSESEKDLQYQMLVQEYAQKRRLGIIFSDKHTLAFGINMPIKTSVLLTLPGYNPFPPLLAHQMMGRAGRRGYDKEGNVVYAGADPLQYVKKEYGCLTGCDTIWYPTYHLAAEFDENYVQALNEGGCLSQKDYKPLVDFEKKKISYTANSEMWVLFRIMKYPHLATMLKDILSNSQFIATNKSQAQLCAFLAGIVGVNYHSNQELKKNEKLVELIEMMDLINDDVEYDAFFQAYYQLRCPDEGNTLKEVEMATAMRHIGQFLIEWYKIQPSQVVETLFERIREYTLKYRTLQYLK